VNEEALTHWGLLRQKKDERNVLQIIGSNKSANE